MLQHGLLPDFSPAVINETRQITQAAAASSEAIRDLRGMLWASNTTSVYTPASIFPMLPEQSSTDLRSLGEGQERLAVVMEMVIAADGAVTASDIYRATVLNRA